METWLVIVLIVLALLVIAGVIWFSRVRTQQQTAARQAQAREHLDEANLRASRAQQEQATAEEQAARARRERAEAEERAAEVEREARKRLDTAEAERAEADAHYRRAEELSPDGALQTSDADAPTSWRRDGDQTTDSDVSAPRRTDL